MAGDLIRKIEELPLDVYIQEAAQLSLEDFVQNHAGSDFLVCTGSINADAGDLAKAKPNAFGTFCGGISEMVCGSTPAEDSIVFEIPWAKLDWTAMLNMLTVGRAPNVAIRLVHQTVSKLHGYFKRDREGNITYADAGSRNGSRVDGKRLLRENEPVQIASRSSISIGEKLLFTFYSPSDFYMQVLKKN